ncbi:MAG: hypothetical protein AAB562_04735 [Patescibacteria group bacterium]
MDQALWQRVLNLVKKTGDRLVVVDPERGEGFVVLPLDAYEAMVVSRGTPVEPARLSENRPEPLYARPPFPAPAKVSTIAPDQEPISPPEAGFLENDSRELEERYYLEPLE